MRILIAHDYGGLVGGAEHMSVTLRDGLRRRGHDARLFASTAAPLPLENQADYTCYGTVNPIRCLLPLGNPHACLRLRQILDEFRPDLVHVRMFHTQLSPWILPMLRDLPAILHVVNYNLICPKNTKTLPDGAPCHYRPGTICARQGCVSWPVVAQQALVRWMTDLSVFDRIITNSHWVRRRLEAEDVRVDDAIWNGVPVRPARPALQSDSVPTVAFAGRFTAKKGIDVLLRAFRAVVDAVPAARLLLAGDGEQRRLLEALIGELRLGEHVTCLGHLKREEMEQRFAGAWVQVVPSTWEEPFGIVAAEAMMRGTAVIATNSGGLAEQVVEGETGFTVAPGDDAAMAAAMMRILQDRDLAERLGRAGRERALASFTEERIVGRFESVYASVLSERATAAPAVGHTSA
jgi:glycosyltransferase involved in cell wall biosynthesis